ncbi:HdeA/HdeB family chaperone [Marimonas sp. MJW-29]|uniref:HdeA/HdeB family chaperone n=1 Tax=Sulfitobacter sediminis TaxID=3234186 RepID=A0ABV3RGK1_9RHOB
MTKTFKTLAAAALMTAISAPAFAAAHMDPTSMTCEEYNQLSGADRDKIAVMAIAAMNDNVQPTDGTATATASSVGTTQEESNSAASQGSATATSIANADDDMTRFAEEIAVLNRVCSRNWDAMVSEAAAGMAGTR